MKGKEVASTNRHVTNTSKEALGEAKGVVRGAGTNKEVVGKGKGKEVVMNKHNDAGSPPVHTVQTAVETVLKRATELQTSKYSNHEF